MQNKEEISEEENKKMEVVALSLKTAMRGAGIKIILNYMITQHSLI